MVKAWAPGHATLFFAVPNQYTDKQKMGSIGGGFNFDLGVTTSIIESNEDKVFWNNLLIKGEVTLTAINLYRKLILSDKKFNIFHESDLPIGFGLSTSGAGTIGALLVVNKILNGNLSKAQLYKIAHEAEIINHTGLGSVIGQITSKIELRLSQGGPDICKTMNFESSKEIIILLFGPLSTNKIITSKEKMDTVTKYGEIAVNEAKKLTANFANEFINIANKFTQNCGLMTLKISNIIEELSQIDEYNCAMAMIGETIIIIPNNKKLLLNWIKQKGYKVLISKITNQYPHLLTIHN